MPSKQGDISQNTAMLLLSRLIVFHSPYVHDFVKYENQCSTCKIIKKAKQELSESGEDT